MRQLIILLFALCSANFAAAGETYLEGKHYERIAEAPTSGERIEVLEIFNYGCPHCVSMQPFLQAWAQALPEHVDLAHMPATFRPDFELYARGYYAAESLGLLNQTHQQMFAQATAKRAPVRSFGEVAQMYAGLGVDAEKLKAASESFAVNMRIREVNQRLPRLKVSFTPSFVVAGKYRVRNESMRNPEEIFAVIDFLVAKERQDRATALAASQ